MDGTPFITTKIGKKRFIKKVIEHVKENKQRRIFYPMNDPENLINDDYIVFNGNNLVYHDCSFKTNGTILNKNKTPINL